MKTTVAFLAPAECLLVLTCSLALFKRDFLFFFSFGWTGIAGGCKSSETHTPTARSVEWIWVTVCRLFGYIRGDAPFKVLLSRQRHQFTANSNIQLLYCFPSLFVSVQSITRSLHVFGRHFPRFLVIDTPDDVSLSFPWPSTLRNACTNMHTGHTQQDC